MLHLRVALLRVGSWLLLVHGIGADAIDLCGVGQSCAERGVVFWGGQLAEVNFDLADLGALTRLAKH